MPVGRIGIQIQEYSAGWQERSRRLYAAAAEVAQTLPLDVDRTALAGKAPARSRTQLNLTIRNWTHRPRAWKAVSSVPWLTPTRSEGRLAGQESLPLILDVGRLTPGGSAEGTITVTDVAAGKAHAVKVTAEVGQVFEFVVGPAYDYLGKPGHAAAWDPRRIEDFATFNVTTGGSESREFVFTNLSGAPLPWKIASPVAWMEVKPASGRLEPGQRTAITVTAGPPERRAATHEVVLTVREVEGPAGPGSPGPARQDAKMVVHVIPPYRPPAGVPKGEPVYLSQLPKGMVKAHRSRAYWYGTSDRRREDFGPKFDEKHNISGGTPQFTVYDIQGGGFAAFSAGVRVSAAQQRVGESAARKLVNFEVWVDGGLRAQSGLMTGADPERLLVVEDLGGARQLELRVRWDRPEAKYLGGTVGIQWVEPALHRGR
jgi:hypothetical protein